MLYLSRASLRKDHDRLAAILFPPDPGQKMAVSHRLVWTMFDKDMTDRPFLYREMIRQGRGEFMILSSTPPVDHEGLFDLDSKLFDPQLEPGNLLHFSLRANPTAQRNETRPDGSRRTIRYDVVMQALHDVAKGEERRTRRPELIRTAGLAWLARQGERAGFSLPKSEAIAVDGYQQIDAGIESRGKDRRPCHSRLDFEGVLRVDQPSLFLPALARGFGRARAFGNGLMLIRRV